MTHVMRIEAFAAPPTESQSVDAMLKQEVWRATICRSHLLQLANWYIRTSNLSNGRALVRIFRSIVNMVLRADKLFPFEMERRRKGSFWQRRMTIKYCPYRALLRSCVYLPRLSDATISILSSSLRWTRCLHGISYWATYYCILSSVVGKRVGGWWVQEYYSLRARRATEIVFIIRVEYLKLFPLHVLWPVVCHAVVNNVICVKEIALFARKNL